MPATVKIGSSLQITVPGTDIKQLFKDVSFWTNDFPKSCGLCQSENVAPAHRLAQGYDYYSAKCQSCGAEYAFGQTKDGGFLFPKREWKPPYKRDGQQAESQQAESRRAAEEAGGDDIPF